MTLYSTKKNSTSIERLHKLRIFLVNESDIYPYPAASPLRKDIAVVIKRWRFDAVFLQDRRRRSSDPSFVIRFFKNRVCR